MNGHAMTAYGLWPLVVLNAGLVILFAASLRVDRQRFTAGAGAPATQGRTS